MPVVGWVLFSGCKGTDFFLSMNTFNEKNLRISVFFFRKGGQPAKVGIVRLAGNDLRLLHGMICFDVFNNGKTVRKCLLSGRKK